MQNSLVSIDVRIQNAVYTVLVLLNKQTFVKNLQNALLYQRWLKTFCNFGKRKKKFYSKGAPVEGVFNPLNYYYYYYYEQQQQHLFVVIWSKVNK